MHTLNFFAQAILFILFNENGGRVCTGFMKFNEFL